jgi:hypothetical protein
MRLARNRKSSREQGKQREQDGQTMWYCFVSCEDAGFLRDAVVPCWQGHPARPCGWRANEITRSTQTSIVLSAAQKEDQREIMNKHILLLSVAYERLFRIAIPLTVVPVVERAPTVS